MKNDRNVISIKKIIKLLVVTYFILRPFYFLDSGKPQISDGLMAITILIYFLKNKKIYSKDKLISIWFLNALFINLISFIFLNDYAFLVSVTFYVYLYSVVLLYYGIQKRIMDIDKYILKGILISGGILLVFLPLLFGGSSRTLLFFNNPNQLGYYALSSLAFYIMIREKQNKSTWNFINGVSIIGFIILIIVSLSRNAIGAMGVLLLIYFIKQKLFKLKYLVLIILMVSPIVYGIIKTDKELLNLVTNRFVNGQKKDDNNFAGRGYDRIVYYPYYNIAGSGEGGFFRFKKSKLAGGEIHSSYGTSLFSYGLIGISTFLLLYARCFKKNKFYFTYPLIAIMIYQIAHNGLRNPIMWIMLCYANRKELKNNI